MDHQTPLYPQNPDEWLQWVEEKLGITKSQGSELFRNSAFPYTKLIECWENEFTVEQGYSPDFIPALVRNIQGFVNWVYNEGFEPNWRNTDPVDL